MAAMYLVVLKKSWPGPFRRTVQIGEAAVQLSFSPGEPIEVDATTAKLLLKDIGKALEFCTVSAIGKVQIIDVQFGEEGAVPVTDGDVAISQSEDGSQSGIDEQAAEETQSDAPNPGRRSRK